MYSSSSKAKSIGLLSKLTNGLSDSSDHKSSSSATELVSKQFNAPEKVTKKKQNKLVQKKLKQDTKELKRIRYELIKSKKEKGSALSEEHEKYLNKLIRKNKRSLINTEYDHELDQLQEEILNYKRKQPKASRRSQHNVPGLTPGLAPVDYNESDDE